MIDLSTTNGIPFAVPNQPEKGIYSPNLVRFNASSALPSTVRQDSGAFQHQGGAIEGPPDTPRTLQQYGTEGFKGGPQSGPPYVSLSDDRE